MAVFINDDNVQDFFAQKKLSFFLCTLAIWLYWSWRIVLIVQSRDLVVSGVGGGSTSASSLDDSKSTIFSHCRN